MNRVCLIGRLTTKPELRTVGNGLSTTRFTLAVNRNFSNANGEREADFISIVAWRKQAENICQYLDKGSLVSVEGRIQTGSFDVKVNVNNLVLTNLQMLLHMIIHQLHQLQIMLMLIMIHLQILVIAFQ